MISSVAVSEWARLVLLYAHLIASMLAIAGVLAADAGLLSGKLTLAQLAVTAKKLPLLLFLLWVSGLTLIWVDTGFNPAELQARPKLLVKLVVVTLLTLNGLVLHWLSFPVLVSRRTLTFDATVLLAVSGAVSTSHWLLAAFLGIAKPLERVPFEQLVESYTVLLLVMVAMSIACTPWLRNRVLNWRRSSGVV